MKNLIAAGLMMFTMGMAALAEPIEKSATTPPVPAPIVTTATAPGTPAQPEVKKEQAPVEKVQPAPVRQKKPVELNFRNF